MNQPTISLEDLGALIKSFQGQFEPKVVAGPGAVSYSNIGGIRVVTHPHVPDLTPVIELSRDVQVSEEFRGKTNRWYIEVFGYRQPSVWRTKDTIFIGPKFYAALMPRVVDAWA